MGLQKRLIVDSPCLRWNCWERRRLIQPLVG